MAVVVDYLQPPAFRIRDQFWLHPNDGAVWPQTNTFPHDLRFPETGQQIVATLSNGHAIVFAPLGVVAVELATSSQGHSLKSGKNVGVVIAVESRLYPGSTHFEHLTPNGNQVLVPTQLLGSHSGAVKEQVNVLRHFEKAVHMLTDNLSSVLQESTIC